MERENQRTAGKRAFIHEKGVTRFGKETERRIFFILTLMMLVWGMVMKLGF